jgi:penicillin-binding protein 1A
MDNTKIKKKGKGRGCVFAVLITFLICLALILFVGLIGGFLYMRTIPTLDELTPTQIAETSKVYAIDGSLLTEFHAEENREIIPFNKMSKNIKDAIIAVEDKRYYEHQGVDYKRIIGAFIADLKSGEIVQGGSTITQQYVKNVYFNPEQTLRRKINEALIAIQIERNYTKDKILEMYLNTIPFGAGSYGIEKASQTYFGVSADQLDVPQAALLAGLVRAPGIYNPFNDTEKAKSRRNLVLKLMYEQGFIDKDVYTVSLSAPVNLNKNPDFSGSTEENRFAPYFIDFVKQQLYDKKFSDYDVFKGGLRIYTTLDVSLQNKAEEAINKVFPEDPGPSYSLVSVDPANGYIYALVGGKDYSQNKFNIVTQGQRQPGSVFKVPVLMESIRQHMSPNDKYNPNGPLVIDMPSGPDWKVENYGGETFESNEMTVVDATIHSVNVVYAQLMMKVGPENVEKMLAEMGIKDIGSNPAIALGGLEKGITPLDVVKIFSTLASGGVYREPVCILKITDSEGNILYEYDIDKNEKNARILESPVAYYVTKILERVISEGTGKGANIGRPAAGKTGTTSDYKDAWFGGYTPELATVVWMGYLETSKPMDKINGRTITGGSFPADIWREFMSLALKDVAVSDFSSGSDELVDVEVCTESGLLPVFWCPKESLGFMIFEKGKEPTQVCNIHNKVPVPDVIGQNINDVRQMFADLNFVVNEIYEFNDTYNGDIIFKTDPAAATILESLTGEPLSINLYISQGLQTYDMPDLKGQTKEYASQILANLGLSTPNFISDFNIDQPVDKIFAQEPAAYSKVTKATPITIYISKGENPEGSIPGVTGLTETDALSTLKSAGYKNITVISEESDKEIDKVFAQVPESGTAYAKSGEVVIKISKGIKVPDTTTKEKAAAINMLEGLGFVVNILPDATAAGKVKNQAPAAGTYLNYGSTVTIEIDISGTTETSATTTSSTTTSG